MRHLVGEPAQVLRHFVARVVAGEVVVAAPAQDEVAPGPAQQDVGAGIPEEPVVALAAVEPAALAVVRGLTFPLDERGGGVAFGIGVEEVVAALAEEDILPGAADEGVRALAAFGVVVAVAELDAVGAGLGLDFVIAFSGEDAIIVGAAGEAVGCGGDLLGGDEVAQRVDLVVGPGGGGEAVCLDGPAQVVVLIDQNGIGLLDAPVGPGGVLRVDGVVEGDSPFGAGQHRPAAGQRRAALFQFGRGVEHLPFAVALYGAGVVRRGGRRR